MSANNPVYGKDKDERSAIFDALLQQYGHEVHVGAGAPVKGLRLKRYEYLGQQLATPYHDGHWRKAHSGILKHKGYDAQFQKSAQGAQIMQTVEELLDTGATKTRRTYIDAKSHTQKDAKGEYHPTKLTK